MPFLESARSNLLKVKTEAPSRITTMHSSIPPSPSAPQTRLLPRNAYTVRPPGYQSITNTCRFLNQPVYHPQTPLFHLRSPSRSSKSDQLGPPSDEVAHPTHPLPRQVAPSGPPLRAPNSSRTPPSPVGPRSRTNSEFRWAKSHPSPTHPHAKSHSLDLSCAPPSRIISSRTSKSDQLGPPSDEVAPPHPPTHPHPRQVAVNHGE